MARVTKGETIQVIRQDGGRPISGTVRFANDNAIAIDEGSDCTTWINYDANSDSWRQGKIRVRFEAQQ